MFPGTRAPRGRPLRALCGPGAIGRLPGSGPWSCCSGSAMVHRNICVAITSRPLKF